jgi:MFS family permease
MTVRNTLGYRYIKRFYLARLISNLGNGMGPIALAFGILHLPHGSAKELGFVLGSQITAMICALPFGGVIADKYGRIKVCAFSDIVGGTVLLVQVYYFHTGNVPIAALLFSNIGFGLMWGLFWPSFSGVLPAILPEANFQQGNAINQFVGNFAVIFGTAVGGYLITAFGSTVALFIDALTFIASGLMVGSFRNLTQARPESGASLREDLREGWRVFASFPWIVATVLGFSFLVMVWSGAQDVLGPVISLKHFHGARSWAFVVTFESLGYLIGSLVGIRVKIRYPMRFLTSITVTLTIYLLLLSRPAPLLAIALGAFAWGVSLDLWASQWGTAFQRTIPREALSRASSFDGMGTMLLRPVGLAVAAPLADLFGIRNTLLIFAGISALVIAVLLSLPSVRQMEMKDTFSADSEE